MAKFTTQVDGKDVEIDLGDEFVPKSELGTNYMPKGAFEAELARRTESITSKQRDKLLEDEQFRNAALEKWGVKPADKAELDKQTTEHLARAQKEWEHKHLSPLQQQLKSRDGEIGGLRDVLLHKEILQAAVAAGVKKSLLKPVAAGMPAPIISMVSQAFGYDDKTKTFYVRNGDTFAFTSKPSEGSAPYKTVEEFVTEWAGDKANSDFVEDRRQGGAALGGTGGSRQTGSHVISREDARDPAKYRAAREAAVKAGITLQIAG